MSNFFYVSPRIPDNYYRSLFNNITIPRLSMAYISEPRSNNKVKNKQLVKCYSARKGLKRDPDILAIRLAAKIHYNGCIHCAWYSQHFYDIERTIGFIVVENDEDFEKLKNQFVKHMNRSHKDICKKKLMKKLKNPEKYT